MAIPSNLELGRLDRPSMPETAAVPFVAQLRVIMRNSPFGLLTLSLSGGLVPKASRDDDAFLIRKDRCLPHALPSRVHRLHSWDLVQRLVAMPAAYLRLVHLYVNLLT